MTEHDLQNRIRLRLTQEGYTTFRTNVGKVKMHDGRWFDTGLPRGFSDLFAVKDGRVCFIECKIHPRKPTDEQVKFLEGMRQRGCAAGVAYTVEEAIKICEGGEST